MSTAPRPHDDSPPDDRGSDHAAEDDVEHGLGTGTPAVLREAAREARREHESIPGAAARHDTTPEHWRDPDDPE